METGITFTAPRITTVKKIGQRWLRLHPSLEVGMVRLDAYAIVRAENGERLILCDLEEHSSSDGFSIEAIPVVCSAVPMWKSPAQEE